MAWQRVCKLVEIATDQAHLFETNGRRIAVARVEDDVFAVDDRCTHEDWSLCDGYVEGGEIVCGLHQARFDLRTGEVTMAPATEPLVTYPARVTDGEVWVDPDTHAVADT
jgi:nitrite reductase/ring-hydroxylating ferredoxin subunit